MLRWTAGTRHAPLTSTGCAGQVSPAHSGPHFRMRVSYAARIHELVTRYANIRDHLRQVESLRHALRSLRKSRPPR